MLYNITEDLQKKNVSNRFMDVGINENVEMINVLTGFKNICALPNEYDKTKEKNFIFG